MKNWPIDRLRRRLRLSESRREADPRLPVGATRASPSFVDHDARPICRNAGDAGVTPTSDVRRVQGRPTTDPPRKRRWNHQLWQDGPKDLNVTQIAANVPNARDAAGRAVSNAAVDTCARETPVLGRGKMLQISRGTCMTPGVRANGPSYMKPVPPPVQRPTDAGARADEPPIVIVRTVATRQEIVACNDTASTFGINPGLTLTEARALCAKTRAFDHDPRADARALEALARWMTRFTPFVSLPPGMTAPAPSRRGDACVAAAPATSSWHGFSTRGSESANKHGLTNRATREDRAAPPHRDAGVATTEEGAAVYLDITGCDRVFGGIANLVRQVIDALARTRLTAGVAVAPTPGAAWALASFGELGTIVAHDDDLAAALAPLPVPGLRLDESIRAALHHLGLETIGQVMNLPRRALPSRFGATLLLRLDQALGRAIEPLVPLPWHAPIEARMEFEGPIESWETIWLVFKQLIGRVIADLTRRGCGARKVDVEFYRADKQVVRRAVALARPSRDARNLFDLIRCATENVDGGDDGFLGVRLHVPLAERLDPEQIALLGREQYEGELELAGLIERLNVRLGDAAIAQPVLVESHVPERAFSWLGHLARADLRSAIPRSGSAETTRAGRSSHSERPLQLLPDPIEIAVMVSPSEDRDGRPILFRLRGRVHRLRHAVGPERISGEWWRGHDKTRDYFDVEDEEGKRFWLFRVNESGRWYVHGEFG